MNVEELQAAVKADVITGLEDELEPRDFAIVGPFASQGALIDTEGTFAVVQWMYYGIDNRQGFNALWPTGIEIRVPGLTVVDMTSDPVLFYRHVDWNEVNSQLGGSLGRTSAPELIKSPDRARANAARDFPQGA